MSSSALDAIDAEHRRKARKPGVGLRIAEREPGEAASGTSRATTRRAARRRDPDQPAQRAARRQEAGHAPADERLIQRP